MRRYLFNWAIVACIALAPASAMASDAQDRAVAEQIAAILRDSGQMQKYSVGVKYKNGTVWLSGQVASKQQMQTALQVISDIEGVEQIVNNLSYAGAKSGGGKSTGAKSKAIARRVSATSAEVEAAMDGDDAEPAMQADGQVSPAGYHHLKRHGRPMPAYAPSAGPVAPPAYDQPHMPNYAWPSYASYPNYAALTYPKQYSASAFPFIGPFYPYPQVPLGWRKVSLEWDDGWWFLDFYDRGHH